MANRVRPAALVLLYHRVTRLDTDSQWLAVPPETFDAQVELLKRRYRVLSLAELMGALRDNRLPRRSVAITFDDGYADNLHQAKPLLEKHGAPATVFVASGFVGGREEFFWDELDRLLLQSGHLPAEIDLAPPHEGVALASPMTCELGENEVWRWSLGDAYAHYTKAQARQYSGWNVLSPETPTPRHAAYRAVCAALAGSDPGTRRRWLDEIRARLGAPADGRESHRTMTGDEVRQLAAGGLVDIGAHTVGHPRLSSLSVDDQRAEITQSKRSLEDVLGRAVSTFSYPFGNHADYTAETVRLVREAGFVAACSNFGGVVRHGGDPFQLNRVLVRDWSPEELDRRLREWFLE
jgi:peptidoglycan/xylan/chitin deacetylase (PgdA/CDA1 family)